MSHGTTSARKNTSNHRRSGSSPDGTTEYRVTSSSGRWAMVPLWILGVTNEAGDTLNESDLRVYIALRGFADKGGFARPFVETIAEHAGVSRRSAERAVGRLRKFGLMTTRRKHRPDGSIALCHYHMHDTPTAIPDGTDTDGGTPPSGMAPGYRQGCRSKNTPDEHTKRTDHRTEQSSTGAARFARSAGGDFENDLEGSDDYGADPDAEARATAARMAQWRRDDRTLFKSLVGDQVTSDGSHWTKGTFPAEAFYKAFRKVVGKPIKWPGAFLQSINDDGMGIEDWMLYKGLETA